MTTDQLIGFTHYIPIATTIISAWFAWVILGRWKTKPEAYHLLWWGLGVVTFGAGTLLESLHALFGWNLVVFKSWYIAGALLGGAPLAIGTIYLQFSRKMGHIAVVLLLATVAVTSVFVVLSPIDYSLVDDGALSSRVLEWQGIRAVSPFINGLAALFLIGGAIYSAYIFARKHKHRNRFIGNVLIAIGAILPGIGGTYSRMGHTEVLYVGEFIGIICIFAGYKYCQRPAEQPEEARASVRADTAGA